MNRKALADKIQELATLSTDEKAEIVKLLTNPKRYGLIWEEKAEIVEELLRLQLPVLDEVTERFVAAQPAKPTPGPSEEGRLDFGATTPLLGGAGGGSAPNHILIEGDNLHALTALVYTHEAKVDLIYIDPPYNTGNKDFKYNDRFVDREDGYRHSKWLSFMAKRLKLAKRLLKDTGVIFISIDDNEQAQLRMLCYEVFSEENFLVEIIWKKRSTPPNDQIIGTNHDYILAFSKSKLNTKLNLRNRTEEQQERYQNPDHHPKGPWTSGDLMANVKGGRYVKSLYFPIKNPNTGEEHYPSNNGNWRFSNDTIRKLLDNNEIYFGKDGKGRPKLKRFLSEVKSGVTYPTIWDFVPLNTEGTSEMLSILGNSTIFDNPKPTNLILEIIKLGSNKSAVVLDFFAGSGTTLHAVMQLNAEDGGQRQCILVTNNENKIAEEVCYERNRRVIQGYVNAKGVEIKGLTNNNLRYYRAGFVGRERTQENRIELTRRATAMLCIKEDCFEEQPTPGPSQEGSNAGLPSSEGPGVGLDLRLFQSADGGRQMLIVYDEDAIADAVDWIQTAPVGAWPIKVYVFSPGAYPFTDDFDEVLDRVELCALPEAIYQAYKNLLPDPDAPPATDEPTPDPSQEGSNARLPSSEGSGVGFPSSQGQGVGSGSLNLFDSYLT